MMLISKHIKGDNMCRCKFPDGFVFKPDGIHYLSPHAFELTEKYKNVTVEILRCKHCGEVSIGWYRQEDTEEVDIND